MRTPVVQASYKAFISYSHADERWAKWLQRRLERFRGADASRGEVHPLYPVFRDRSELAAGELGQAIERALAGSSALIVVCSPAAVESAWVAAEIRAYKRLHGIGRIYPFVVAGSGVRYSDNLPEPLHYRGDEPGEPFEILAADARADMDGRDDAFLKLVAALLDVSFDALKRRSERYRRRRLIATTSAASVIALGAVVLSISAMLAREDADRRREQADNLITFMLGDLSERLDTIGRLDILDAVGDQSLDYFESLTSRDVTPVSLEQRARALRQIGAVRVAQNRLEDGLELYTQSLTTLARALVLGDRESTRYEMALAYEAESVVHYMREDLPASLASTEQYRALMAELVASAPENTTFALELVQADNNLGAIAFGLGDTEAAEKHFLASLSSATRLSSEQPDNARFRSTTGGVLVWLGHVAERRDDMVAALEWYARALAEERMAAQTDPQPAYQEPLARTLTILAVAVRSTDPEVSLAYAGEAVELLRSLTSHDPDNANWRQKLHRAMTIDVASRLELGCDAGTPHLLEEVRASSADLLTTDEGYIEIHRDRIDADVLLARWMAGTGDYPGAADIAAEAVDRGARMLARNAADDVSVRYYLRAVEVLTRTQLLQRDFDAARRSAEGSLERLDASEVDDPSAAAIAVWLLEVAESDDSAAAALTRRAAQATVNAARC